MHLTIIKLLRARANLCTNYAIKTNSFRYIKKPRFLSGKNLCYKKRSFAIFYGIINATDVFGHFIAHRMRLLIRTFSIFIKMKGVSNNSQLIQMR